MTLTVSTAWRERKGITQDQIIKSGLEAKCVKEIKDKTKNEYI